MKRKIISFISIFLFFSTPLLFAEKPPLEGWVYTDGIVLNGKQFKNIADSYLEQDGYVYLEKIGKVHFWLYNTYKYHNGEGSKFFNKYLPRWVESMGYAPYYEGSTWESPNNHLQDSIKILMQQRGCDLSVAIIDFGTSVLPPVLMIHNYDKSTGQYSTVTLPLFK